MANEIGQVGKNGRKPTATRPLLPHRPSRLPRQVK